MTPCSAQDPCFFNQTNVDSINSFNCKLSDLTHRANCCSVHMQCSGQRSACLSAGDVTPQQMMAAVAELEKAVAELKKKVQTHAALHQVRVPRGRQGKFFSCFVVCFVLCCVFVFGVFVIESSLLSTLLSSMSSCSLLSLSTSPFSSSCIATSQNETHAIRHPKQHVASQSC